MSTITVTPDPFTLVPYDAAEIRDLLEHAVAQAGIDPSVDIELSVDEELFAPLTGHMSDVVDGRLVLWISGANFEDNKRPCHFSADQARTDLAVMALRAADRLSGDFADAPPDAQLERGTRAAWDAYASGRAGAARRRSPCATPAVRLSAPARIHRHRRRGVRALLERRADDVRRDPRDLQGDGCRRPARRRRFRSTCSARNSAPGPLDQSRSWAEIES